MPVYKLSNKEKPNLERTILFSHIPKTGGTSFDQAFKSMGFDDYYSSNPALRNQHKVNPAHFEYKMLDSLFEIEKFSVSFAVVRHPEERFISDYKWAMTSTNFSNTIAVSSEKPTINDWVKFAFDQYDRNPYFLANHIKPQHMFVGSKILNVFRFEDGLETIFEQVLGKCGIKLTGANPLAQGKYNSTTDLVFDTALSDESRHKIQTFYADDYDRFGYTKVS